MAEGSEHIHFITGKLAANALKNEVARLSKQFHFEYTIQVLPITVAALLTPEWIAARLEVPSEATQIMLPGYARGDLAPLQAVTRIPVYHGPKDLRELGPFLGGESIPVKLDTFDVEIIAEINNAPLLTMQELRAQAVRYASSGADVIDVGCLPNSTWHGVEACVAMLRSEGLRVSIDSLNPTEISAAARAGAELVLSVNSSNREQAADWGCEVVVIPDSPEEWRQIEETLSLLDAANVPFRVDPILEPIGFGFAQSLSRYMEARQRWPQVPMMMGIGNITELSDVDSAGLNFLLLAICQELKIFSVLTTEVINWAQSSVKECDIARRLLKYSIDNGLPPKRICNDLICLRDSRLLAYGPEYLAELQGQVRDRNYRILAEAGETHVFGLEDHFHDRDPFALFDQMAAAHPRNLDPSHAFYLGYELAKAELALNLGKQYTQDEPLRWGHLTPENQVRHRIKRRKSSGSGNDSVTSES